MEPRLCIRRVSDSAPGVTSEGTVYLHVTWGQPLSSARWTSAWRTVSSQKPPAGIPSDGPTCGVHPVDRPLGAPGSQGQGPGAAAAAGGGGAQEAEEEAERVGPAQVGPLSSAGAIAGAPAAARTRETSPAFVQSPLGFLGGVAGGRGEGSTVAPCRVASEKQVPGVQALCCLRGGPSACAPGAQGERTTDEGQPGLLYLIQVRLGWLGRRGGLANISSELACVTCP